MDDDQFDPSDVAGPARFIGATFGLIFLAIGVTVLGFLWGAPLGEFGSPPLFFRIFGSFIALAFVAMGAGTAYAAITGKPQKHIMNRLAARRRDLMNSDVDEKQRPPARDGYSCESCGATLDGNADVSPHGDVKCDHCGGWFNIHSRS